MHNTLIDTNTILLKYNKDILMKLYLTLLFFKQTTYVKLFTSINVAH